jgi:hypothetical protein
VGRAKVGRAKVGRAKVGRERVVAAASGGPADNIAGRCAVDDRA